MMKSIVELTMEANQAKAAGAKRQPSGKPAEPIMAPKAKASPHQYAKKQKIQELDEWELRAKCAEAEHRDLDPCILVCAAPELVSTVVNKGDVTIAAALQRLSGGFHHCALDLFGCPIWKSITFDSDPDPQVSYWFRDANPTDDGSVGWYCASHVFVSHKDFNKCEKHYVDEQFCLIAWSKGDACRPMAVHFPWDAKAVEDGIQIGSLWDASVKLMEQKSALECRVADLENSLDELGGEAKDAEEPEGTEDPDEHGYHEEGEAAGAAEGPRAEHGDEHERGKSRNGWMPRMAQLVAAVKTENWNYVGKLCQRFLDQSPALADLVWFKQARWWREQSKGKSKGKGKSRDKNTKTKSSSSADVPEWDQWDEL